MPNCPGCATPYSSDRALTLHKKNCQATFDQARIAWETEQQRAAKRRRVDDVDVNGDTQAGAMDYPAFLWRDGTADITDFYQGFGEGCLICKGLQHIFVSPSSAKSIVGSSHSNRKGRARIHNIMMITPSMIAYVACMTHFALSSQTTFSSGAETERGRFWYESFYNGLVRTMEDMPADLRRALLNFHNVKVLCASREAADSTAGATQGTHGLSVAQHMAAQASAIATSAATPGAGPATAEGQV
ncbi:hypothetical protein EVJ58_g3732 [Rhodofomes roseus]|uniref:Uncharacterized protein n=1 Tax=Rhodofomes roseus TaxID=34475 RepID=A0A4Y9YMF4_9APHY|nr:hypothetical protein EVJ58_g3732 [Rhodofomes roseus]